MLYIFVKLIFSENLKYYYSNNVLDSLNSVTSRMKNDLSFWRTATRHKSSRFIEKADIRFFPLY